MSRVKNQHYIPQLYLRHFSTDEKQKTIGLFNLKNDKFIRHAPIKNQASRDYFYGEDGVTERLLGTIEGNASPLLKAVIGGKQLPTYYSHETASLYIFCLLMKIRTEINVANTQAAVNAMMQKILGYDELFKDYADKIRFDMPGAAEMSVYHALNAMQDALDLKFKVLVDETPTAFVTSDNPMCSYNQFLERHKHPGGHYGIFAKGLELFLPISPRVALFFYDDWAYKVGDRAKTSIALNRQSDVDKLNALQLLQCGEQPFFSADVGEHYVRTLLRQHKNKRHSKNSVVKHAGSRIDEEGRERILMHMHGANNLLTFQFTFCTLTKKAKQHELSDYATQLRDERIRHKRRN